MANNQKPPSNQQDPGNGSDPDGPNGNFIGRSWFWIVLIVLALFGSRLLFNRPSDSANMIGLNEVAQSVMDDRVDKLVIQGDVITVVMRDDTRNAAAKRTAKVY